MNNNILDYYKGKTKADLKTMKNLGLCFIIFGIIVLSGALLMIINGSVSIGINAKYSLPVMHEGGTTTILGLISFIGGFLNYRNEKKKEIFFSSLINKNNNL